MDRYGQHPAVATAVDEFCQRGVPLVVRRNAAAAGKVMTRRRERNNNDNK